METIGGFAFQGCTSLVTVTFEKDLNGEGHSLYLSSNIFKSCTSLTTIEIPARTLDMFSPVFQDCTNLTTVTFEKDSKLRSLPQNAFSCLPNLTIIDMSECKNVESVSSPIIDKSPNIQIFKLGTRTPPNVSSYLGSIPASATLQVPANSISSYRTARGWKDFPTLHH